MFRAIRHAFAQRKGGHSPAAPSPVSAERPPALTSAPVPSSSSIEFEGVSFPVVRAVADFVATTASSDRVALRLCTKQYATHMRDIMQRFESKYAPSSPEYQAFKHTCLVCAGCGWKFPSSYTLSLIAALDSHTHIMGATPGFAEFGKTGTCTKCGSAESFLTYQRYEPSSISQADVDAIHRYWRHLAILWWYNADISTAICDGCNDDVGEAETYLIGGNLECKRCTDEQLADGLNKLRHNPHYFGAIELQKARSYSSKDTYKVWTFPYATNHIDNHVEGCSQGASAAFQSLVERSITAWDSLNYVGEDRAFTVHRIAGMLRGLSSLEALLQNRQFWFFQLKESFIQQQLLLKWDPARLDEYILLPLDYGFANCKDCFFVSHYWHSREHPDPKGHDMSLFLEDFTRVEWSYVWVDWTCMPQAPRSVLQQTYFTKMLEFIPALVRDCGFAWRFPAFEPRAWILFEVAQYTLKGGTYTVTPDLRDFISHVHEMYEEGVRRVFSKYRYTCTNGSDLQFVTGWLELLVILAKCVPNVSSRRTILDHVDRGYVGGLAFYDMASPHTSADIEIDKAKGIVSCNGATYRFTPLFPRARMTVTAETGSPKGDELGIPTTPSFHLPRKQIIF
jgi:hypothetical protein